MAMPFNEQELETLRNSPYVSSVSPKIIRYGELFENEYHRLFQLRYTIKECFETLGLDPEIIGKSRINAYHKRYKQRVEEGAFVSPTLGESPKSISQIMTEKDHRIKLLEQEVEFLKKKRLITDHYMKMKDLNNTTSD